MSKYNLADEPWICLLDKNGKEKKEGLERFFLDAHRYTDLGGETRMQDMAVLRFLAAISVTLIYRYDENGDRRELTDWVEADERAQALLKAGKFPEKAVKDYFRTWHDRFWLFDDDRPVMQVPANRLEWKRYGSEDYSSPGGVYPYLKNGIRMGWAAAPVINGLILASANRPNSPFKTLSGEDAEALEYDEAARWMLFYNAYADASYGKRQSYMDGGRKVSANVEMTLPSKGILIAPYGNDLFETLLFCSVLYTGDDRKLWKTCRPAWEEDDVTYGKESKKPVPDDLARMYTQQARRICLAEKDGKVSGAYISAGESYIPEQVQADPMLVAEKGKNKKTGKEYTAPAKISTPFWDRFLFVLETDGRYSVPIIRWTDRILKDAGTGRAADWYTRTMRYRTTCVEYGSAGCSYQLLETGEITADQAVLSDEGLRLTALEYARWAGRVEVLQDILEDRLSLCKGTGERKKKNENDRLIRRMFRQEAYSAFRSYMAGKLEDDALRNGLLAAAESAVDRYIAMHGRTLIKGKKETKNKEGTYAGNALAAYWKAYSKLEKEVMESDQ